MPSVKIKDNQPGPTRRNKLWECLGVCKIDIWKMKDGKGVYFVILDKENCQKLLDTDVKATFKSKSFEVLNPPDLNANKTLVIRNLDRQIDEWDEDNIKQYLMERNEWLKVENVIKIPTTSKIIKVKCEKESMVERALKDGIYVCHQFMRPEYIEKELFIKLTPCYNCFEYEHLTKDCQKEKQIICTNCSETDHNQENCNKTPKCINCKGQHRTLAAVCPIRKNIIKEKSKAIRQRARSQSRSVSRHRSASNQRATYAEKAKSGKQQQQPQQQMQMPPNMFANLPENAPAVIMSAIAYSHFMESMHPGTFQRNMDEIYKLNGIPLVKFPSQINTEGIFETFTHAAKENQKVHSQEIVKIKEAEQRQKQQEEQRGAEPEGAIALNPVMDTQMETAEETSKRTRTEMESPTESRDEERKQKRIEKQQEPRKLDTQKVPPMSEPPKEMRLPRERDTKPAATVQKEVKRSESLTRTNYTEEDIEAMDIRIYVPKSAKHSNSKEGVERIMNHFMQGRAKATWTQPELTRRDIVKAFLQETIKPHHCNFYAIDDEEYNNLKEGVIPAKQRKHSSTTYEL